MGETRRHAARAAQKAYLKRLLDAADVARQEGAAELEVALLRERIHAEAKIGGVLRGIAFTE